MRLSRQPWDLTITHLDAAETLITKEFARSDDCHRALGVAIHCFSCASAAFSGSMHRALPDATRFVSSPDDDPSSRFTGLVHRHAQGSSDSHVETLAQRGRFGTWPCPPRRRKPAATAAARSFVAGRDAHVGERPIVARGDAPAEETHPTRGSRRGARARRHSLPLPSPSRSAAELAPSGREPALGAAGPPR